MRSWREQNTRAKQHDAMKQPHSLNVTTFFLPEITIYYAWPSAVLVFPSHTSPCREAKKTKIYKCIKSLIPYQFQPFFNSTLFMMTYRCTAKTTAQSIIFFILLRHNQWRNRKKILAMCEPGQLIEEPFIILFRSIFGGLWSTRRFVGGETNSTRLHDFSFSTTNEITE